MEPEPAAPSMAAIGPALTLEFELAPAAAARLARHPAISAARSSRARSAAEELIWLDGTEGELAEAGLVLEAGPRGARRLQRILPDGALPWLPGTPAGPAGEPEPEAAGEPAPIAAFSGRHSLLPLVTPEGAVQADLLAGKLRAVAAERPVARLRLTGPAPALLALARQLAADLPMLPPRATLAEEGRALALGAPPRPRRHGPPRLDGAATVEEALLAAIGHLLEAMLYHAPACHPDAGPEGVHQMRVALRRLRSVLRVFRPAARCPAVEDFGAGLKALARLLGPARDWDVFLAGLGAEAAAALGPDRRISALLKAAEARRQAAYLALRQELDGPGFRRLVLDGLALLLRRPWREAAEDTERQALLSAPLPEFAARLLDRRWRKFRAEGEEIAAHSAGALHELRLSAKRLRYAAELFAPLWPGKASRRFLKRLSRLQEELGLANDSTVARMLVGSLAGVPAWAVGAMEGFAAAQLGRVRRHALSAWEDLMLAAVFWSDS
ncbi:MAG: CHAD domain-containing protein [Acetobacteraceae bacterium]|nr:CHAD domain-containing protein [Acetobacteraceae bacterium]